MAKAPPKARPKKTDAKTSPDLAVKSTQISLESTVPWEKRCPTASVRTTTSIKYVCPG